MTPAPLALVYGATAGVGGLGTQAATAAAGLATTGPIVALGPGAVAKWPIDPPPANLVWDGSLPVRVSWFTRSVLRRLAPGRVVFDHDRAIGEWAVGRLPQHSPRLVYAFTQVGLEALRWAKRAGVPTVLDNPNTHIREFARVYREESKRLLGRGYNGHPTDRMIARVEEEYQLADRIRVSSVRAKASMAEHGVPADKVAVIPQPIDLVRYRPPTGRAPTDGPLRVCYVGTLDLRKGFVNLLRACRQMSGQGVSLVVVGATGDRGSRRLFAAESAGLAVTVAPGDPVPAYHRADLFVLPSLEDGFGFVVAEAMACGLPVVVTDHCGSAEWVTPGRTGWVVPPGDPTAIAAALREALDRRAELPDMGVAARRDVERLGGVDTLNLLGRWVVG